VGSSQLKIHSSQFSTLPQEQALPGTFTNGVYAIAIFNADIANEKGHAFRKQYLKK
jgi:hypothetical protein